MGNSLGNRILFPAPASTYNETMPGLVIETDIMTGRKHASLFIPASTHQEKRPYLLYFHGNACDIGSMHHELSELADHSNTNVVAVEYPGYGVLSGPEPTAAELNAAAEFALDYLLKRNISPQRIVLFGRSIGSGIACKLAQSAINRGHHIGGLVLQSPYTSIHGIVRDYSSLGPWLIPDHWQNDEFLSSSELPLLIIHGEADEIISPAHGKRLFEVCKATRKRLLLPPHATHNEWHLYADVIFPVRDFVLKYLVD